MGFSYDNSVSLQTDDAGHVGAAVLAQATWPTSSVCKPTTFFVTERGLNSYCHADFFNVLLFISKRAPMKNPNVDFNSCKKVLLKKQISKTLDFARKKM